MPTCSITRLRLRRFVFLPGFIVHSLRSTRQAETSPGFLGGYLALGPRLTFWTVTLWRDQQAMRDYRRTGSHLEAMPKLLNWCDEASVATLEGETQALPDAQQAAERLRDEGRVSKVLHPSPGHASGGTWPDGKTPRRARELQPR